LIRVDIKKHLRTAGLILFAAGFVAALAIYRGQPAENEGDLLSKRDIYQIEKLGGKEYVFGVEMNAWFTGVWHGRRLAYTVIFLSGAGCIGCFLLADFLDGSSNTKSKSQDKNS